MFTPSSGTGAERAEELRRRYPRFVYERFAAERAGDALRVKFHFRAEPDLGFAPETVFPGVDWARVDALPEGTLENLLFHIGLIETLSYWKATCSPEIRVEAGALDEEQTGWFLGLLRRGMGEYFYVNGIDWRGEEFVRVVGGGGTKQENQVQVPRRFASRDDKQEQIPRLAALARDDRVGVVRDDSTKNLVLTSGGKDSVVTLELLREALSATGQPFDCLLLNPTEAAIAVARQAGCENPILVRRTIDPRLLELNDAGYLNGHTPFSALLAVLGVTAATIHGYRRVIVSNERSAEEAGVEYLGEPINHQYSKTFRFETRFRVYCRTYLTPARNDRAGIEYFSLLRPLYELQIARLFAQYPAYFPIFRSCNRGMKANAWCGECSKCLFVFTVLYPFVEREQVIATFGKDLFAWDGAAAGLRALLGLDRAKPFECVGTREETLAAVYLCVERIKQQGVSLPPALQEMEKTVLSSRNDLPELARRILTAWGEEHHVPSALAGAIRRLHR